MTAEAPWSEEALHAQAKMQATRRVALLMLEGDEQAALDEAHREPYAFLWENAKLFVAGWKAAMELLGHEA